VSRLCPTHEGLCVCAVLLVLCVAFFTLAVLCG
jgi:hypothetical protein